MQNHNLVIWGIPEGVSETTAAVCRSRLLRDIGDFLDETGLKHIEIKVATPIATLKKQSERESQPNSELENEFSKEKRAIQYIPQKPLHNFDRLVLDAPLQEDLLSAIELVLVESLVFDQWELRSIEPFPRTVLNFHGPPGTGKTLAAHAIANRLQKDIIIASYAQIESMYLGVGTKNLEALFYAAEQAGAVLFIDEADSLLSKRMSNVTQGSERAANSMCSQLLICLEKFQGIIIFATNLVENYDRAFETRVKHIYFPMPNEDARKLIWRKHLPEKLPKLNVSVDELAKVDDVCGRDIKNAVIDAAIRAARQNKSYVEMQDLLDAIARIKSARISSNSQKLTADEETKVKEQLKVALSKQESQTIH